MSIPSTMRIAPPGDDRAALRTSPQPPPGRHHGRVSNGNAGGFMGILWWFHGMFMGILSWLLWFSIESMVFIWNESI